MDKCFNKSICNILKNAEKEMFDCHHPYVGTEHLLLSLLKNSNIKVICSKFNLTYKAFKIELLNIIGSATKKSEHILYTPLLKNILDNASNKAYEDHKDLDEYYLLNSLLNESDGIALRIITNMGVDIESLSKEINKPELVYELGINLNESNTDEIFLRDKEITEIMTILLRKNKNNPLLIGHSGVGKTAIVEELAHRIKKGDVPDNLKKYEIIEINTSTLIAGTKYRGEFESRINNLIKEVIKSKNIILFIDEIHTIIKTGASDGSIDAANILKPYLARGDLKVIGSTTISEYNEYLKKDKAFLRRFDTIMVNEPNYEDMKFILNKIRPNYESYYHLKINKNTIDELITLCKQYLPNEYNPDKCIDVLDTACSKKIINNYQKGSKENIITKEDIFKVIKNKANISLFDETKLNDILSLLKRKYNEQIIKNIISVIKSKSLNKYMFLNGINIDKKKILEYIAEKLNINKINLDCKEFSDEYSLNKILSNNYLFNQINEQPFSFIIIDNYDDSNKILYNLINTMITKGYITNNSNEKTYLNNSIIFILNNKSSSSLGFNIENNLLITS